MPARTTAFARSAAFFVAVGAVLYALLAYAAEGLVVAHGQANPFFKIATLERAQDDWVILGASHAMPLDFGGFNAQMEGATGRRITNLAATGAGPLYNRFVFEHYLRSHRTARVLYVVDSFAFASPTWNEERLADAKLLARTPWNREVASALAGYVRDEGVDWRAWLDYVSRFSKINNRDRFKPDQWEGQAQFDRQWRASASAVKRRIEYLYPAQVSQAQFERHLAQFSQLLAAARAGGAQVVLVKLPLPAAFRDRLPAEAAFDQAMASLAARHGAQWHDWSGSIGEPAFFFDSDHLNRAGVQRLFDRQLKTLLTAAP